ncbi:MAG: DNA-binding protein [Desulfamplus sp.]|nr:DNA-binding protein [Desulfamplus sp.]
MPNTKLTDSPIDRQNILNNSYALLEIENAIDIKGIPFRGKFVLLKEQIAAFFEVTTRTIENYLGKYEDELRQNGYEVLKGKPLKELKLAIQVLNATETDFGNIFKSSQVGIFDFRAFLNLGMVITESNRAQLLRQLILDIVIDTINKKTGGGTKYINQRDEDFIISWFSEENYRKQFTDALKNCVNMGNFKYAIYTDKIYLSIFKEKAKEYRKILKLQEQDKTRETFYSEILDLVSSYEYGFSVVLAEEHKKKGTKLSPFEVDQLFYRFESLPHWKPLVEKARNKMASRDLAFRDALHYRLEEYITPVEAKDFERFIGEKSEELSKRLEDAKDVMKRLKDR